MNPKSWNFLKVEVILYIVELPIRLPEVQIKIVNNVTVNHL